MVTGSKISGMKLKRGELEFSGFNGSVVCSIVVVVLVEIFVVVVVVVIAVVVVDVVVVVVVESIHSIL